MGISSILQGGCGRPRVPAESSPPEFSEPIASERQTSLAGRTVQLPQRGKVTVLDFWATWCKPCQAVLPELEAVSHEYRKRGVVVIGIASEDNPGVVSEHVKALGLTYEQILDDSGTIRGTYHVSKLPRTIVIDGRGKVRFVLVEGENEGRQIRAAVEAALKP